MEKIHFESRINGWWCEVLGKWCCYMPLFRFLFKWNSLINEPITLIYAGYSNAFCTFSYALNFYFHYYFAISFILVDTHTYICSIPGMKCWKKKNTFFFLSFCISFNAVTTVCAPHTSNKQIYNLRCRRRILPSNWPLVLWKKFRVLHKISLHS